MLWSSGGGCHTLCRCFGAWHRCYWAASCQHAITRQQENPPTWHITLFLFLKPWHTTQCMSSSFHGNKSLEWFLDTAIHPGVCLLGRDWINTHIFFIGIQLFNLNRFLIHSLGMKCCFKRLSLQARILSEGIMVPSVRQGFQVAITTMNAHSSYS